MASARIPTSGLKADLADEVLTGDEIPQDVAESIRWRLGLLPAASRELLGVVAAANRAIPFSVMLSVSRHLGHSEQDQVGALEAAQHARLLIERDGEGYRFTHDLIREVVWEDLSMARRVFLHRQLADVLEHSRAHGGRLNAAELAWHLLQAHEEARALPYALLAGDQAAAVCAYAEAENHYHTTLGVARDLGDWSHEAEAREKLGGIAFTLARYDDALAFYTHAAAAYQAAGDLEGEVRVATQLGWVHTLRGTPDEGLELIKRLLDLSATGRVSVHTRVTLYDTLAQFHFGRGCYHEQLAAAECAADLARSAGDDALLSRAEIRRGAALVHMGRCDEALEALEGAIPLAEATGELWNLAMALNYAGLVYLFRSEFEHDRSYAQRGLELAERVDDPALIAYMLFRRAMPTFYAREWNAARMDLQRSAALSDQLGTSWLSGCALLGLGLLDMAEGQSERGAAYLQQVITEGARVNNPGMVWFARGALAERDLLDGNPQTALDWLAPLVDRSLNADGQLALFMPLVAWAYLDLGDEAQADQWMARALTCAGEMGYRATVAETLRVRALAAMRLDEWAHAAVTLEEALVLDRGIPDPYAEAKTLRVYGLLHLRKGEQTQARKRLESALAILNRLGERLYAEHIERDLIDIG
jgi:tetratricopeptide (TPR) repeat protein